MMVPASSFVGSADRQHKRASKDADCCPDDSNEGANAKPPIRVGLLDVLPYGGHAGSLGRAFGARSVGNDRCTLDDPFVQQPPSRIFQQTGPVALDRPWRHMAGHRVRRYTDSPLSSKPPKRPGCRTATGGHMVEAAQDVMADFLLQTAPA